MTAHVFLHKAVGPLACNCYVVGDEATRTALVVDPGGDADDLVAEISALGLRVSAIVATHAHFDHVLAAERMREVTGAPFHLHDEDRVLLDWLPRSVEMFLGIEGPAPPTVDSSISEGDVLHIDGAAFEVLHTPGHSPGSIVLVSDGLVLAGDTLFAGSVGRTDLPGGDTAALVRAIRARLFTLPGDALVLPGHGPPTTIETERRSNPFVGARGVWAQDL